MKIGFPYPGYERIDAVEVPDPNVLGVYEPLSGVRDGGTLIVIAPNPEGVADNHNSVLEIGYRPYAEIAQMVDGGEMADVVGAAVLADVAQVMDRMDCILVSPGVTRADTQRLGFRYAETPQEALRMAFALQGNAAKVAVLRQGGRILPLIDHNATSNS